MTDIDDTQTTPDEDSDPTSDRRGLLAKLAVGGAGAAVGAVALSRSVSAADGSEIKLGEAANNTSTTPTTIKNTPVGATTEGPSALTVVVGDRGIDGFPFPAAVGGYGHTNLRNGVHGSTDQRNGFGSVAANVYDADAPNTEFAPVALAALCSKGPQMRLIPNGEFVGPFPGRARAGELFNDKDGTLWCVVPVDQSDPEGDAKFTRICGTPTVGALTLLPTPQRCADTRLGRPTGRLGKSGEITVDLKEKTDGAPTGVVADANAAEITLTVTNTLSRGFFRAFSADETPPGESFSNGNWVGDNLSVASNFITRCSNGEIKVSIGGNGTCDVVVDVIGFYR